MNDTIFMALIMLFVIGLRIFLATKPPYHRLIIIKPIVNSWILLLSILFSCYLMGKNVMLLLCGVVLLKSLHEIIRLWFKNKKFPNKINRLFFIDIILLFIVLIFIFSLVQLTNILFLNHHQFILLFILFCIQINDVCQYTMGKLLGHKFFKQKLAKSISPNKTIEGAIFGVLLMSVFAMMISPFLTPFNIVQAFLLAMVFGILGIVGDLFQSFVKRRHNIKDMGFWLKGHGGLLDRIDSLLFTIPCFYLIYLWFN